MLHITAILSHYDTRLSLWLPRVTSFT